MTWPRRGRRPALPGTGLAPGALADGEREVTVDALTRRWAAVVTVTFSSRARLSPGANVTPWPSECVLDRAGMVAARDPCQLVRASAAASPPRNSFPVPGATCPSVPGIGRGLQKRHGRLLRARLGQDDCGVRRSRNVRPSASVPVSARLCPPASRVCHEVRSWPLSSRYPALPRGDPRSPHLPDGPPIVVILGLLALSISSSRTAVGQEGLREVARLGWTCALDGPSARVRARGAGR